jgi:N6-adenosine-specific RNA methylase IME4
MAKKRKLATARQRELKNRKAAARRQVKKATSAKHNPHLLKGKWKGDLFISDTMQKEIDLSVLKTKAKLTPAERKKLLKLAPRPDNTRWPSEIEVGDRFRKDKGDIALMAASINDRGGFIHPPSIDKKDRLIAGERRMLGWQHPTCKFRDNPMPVTLIDVDQLIAAEHDENAIRKDFTLQEAVAIKKAMMPKLKAQAKERQRQHGGTTKGRKADKTVDKGRADDRAAKLVGKDRKTLAKAEAVVDAATRDPGKFGKLLDDMNKSGRADAPFRRLQVMQQAEAIRSAPPPLPNKGPYRGGIIDVPWPAEPEETDPERLARGYYPYPTMSIDELAAVDVKSLLHPDGALVGVWATNYHLALGHHLPLLKAWDLTPVTIRTWVKDRMGRGQVLRGQTEQLIVCRFGNPVIDVGNLTTFFHAAVNVKAHSEKPQKAYDDFVRLVASERYFSLFETVNRGEKWDSHGDGKRAGDPEPLPDQAELAKTRTLHDRLMMVAFGDGGLLIEEERVDLAQRSFVKGKERNVLSAAGRKELDRLIDERVVEQTLPFLEAVEAGGDLTSFKVDRYIKHKLIVGVKKPKLTKHGRARLDALREGRAREQLLAALPTDYAGLVSVYKAAMQRHHVAVLGGNADAMRAEAEQLDLIEDKVSDLDVDNDKDDERELREQLPIDCAAAIGEVPMWGQMGLFRMEVDGVAYIVGRHGGSTCFDEFDVWAESDAPFLSETGYRNFMLAFEEDDTPPACSVDVWVADRIRAYFATPDRGPTSRGKPKLPQLEKPEVWYRLPVSWGEMSQPDEDGDRMIYGCEPIRAGGEHDYEREMRERAEKKGKKGVAKAKPDAQETVYRVAPDIVDAIEAQGQHIVSMHNGSQGEQLATCQCGKFEHSTPRNGIAAANAQTRAIEQHWRDVLAAPAAAAPATPSDAPPPNDGLFNEEMFRRTDKTPAAAEGGA